MKQQCLELLQRQPWVYNERRQFQLNYSGVRTHQDHVKYPSNFIKTSRYTLLTFLPLSLLMQFVRYANIYFLVIAIVQSISIISPLNPASAIAPLVFVLGLSMVREGFSFEISLGFEDYNRHVSDDEVNATPAKVMKSGTQKSLTWTHLEVGDLVLVEENEAFPADLVILGSELESGACYIETSSLDGEKNLKNKSALKETQDFFNNLSKYTEKVITIEAQVPSQALYEYDGSINIEGKKVIVGSKQLLLRGAYLRNTKWILGVIVYTGQDTKIMRNAEPGRVKQSAIELQMNTLILAILMIQLSLCIVTSILCSYFQNFHAINHWYLGYDPSTFTPNLNAFLIFFSSFLLYNTMIPISLVVSLEFVKVFQSFFIEKDEEMFTAQRSRYASVKTTTINEELGQVEYIFSDKTGTLTCNQMEFKYCIIGDSLYGKNNEQQGISTRSVGNQAEKQQPSNEQLEPTDQDAPSHTIYNFKDSELQGIIEGKNDAARQVRNLVLSSQDGKSKLELKTQKDLVQYYIFLLASAHECLYQVDKQGNPIYQGPSPDEITLVDAAARMGFKFLGSSASQQTFDIQGKNKKIELLNSFEFDSDRKRMSVIIRDEGVIKLLIKGADSIVKARLSKNIEQLYLPFIENQLDEFSRFGLRTLTMATKIISEDEYKVFNAKLLIACDSPNKQSQINQLTNELEQDLYLIGATAVEDKLQPLVPETIADFLKANIKVWMLTGDKLETAENIAKSCRLIQGDMTVMRISEKTVEEVQRKLKDNRDTFDLCVKENRKKSLLIEGDSLTILLANEDLRLQFVDISKDCESVVCCRVTPMQKAQVVKCIKKSLNKITLAIGDGANDVNMIQEAHIGIGLYGNEGMRAVQSSDFALGEFRCLWRLLLVHGHWSYIRISEMILYFFYKNMIFTIPQFFFAFFCGYSAQSFFDDWYITFYNMIFTALPLIIRATMDQDINYKLSYHIITNPEQRKIELKQEDYLKKKFPFIYYVGQQKTIFTIPNFIFWSFQGALHGLIVFFGGYAAFDFAAVHKTGFTMDLPGFQMTLITAIIFIVDIKICIYTKFWTWINFIAVFFFSLIIYFVYMCLSQYYIGTLSLYTPFTLFTTPHFWLLNFVLCGIVFIFDLVQGQIIRELFSNQVDEVRGFVQNFSIQLKNWNHFQNDQLQKIKGNKVIPCTELNGSFWDELKKEEDKQPINLEANENQFRQQDRIV